MAFIRIPRTAWIDFKFMRCRTILDCKPVEDDGSRPANIGRRLANRLFRRVHVSPVIIAIREVVEEMPVVNVGARSHILLLFYYKPTCLR
jgi:hypothetical protein